MDNCIKIVGARINNLKNLSVEIPRGKFVVITGVSGSGKSSLAFDTLYAEGQRRYVESLSTYARQFLGRLGKPDCDFIEGIPPAIAIEQKVIARNPRSTVGTSSEIYDYLRMLYAHIGHTFSPVSGEEVHKDSTDDVVEYANSYQEGTKFMVLIPLIVHDNRSLRQQLEIYAKEGFARIEVNNDIIMISDYLEKATDNQINSDNIKVVIDRLIVKNDKPTKSRLADSVETALYEGDGICILNFIGKEEKTFSLKFEADGIEFEEPNEQMFSFNSPAGACPYCEGFGKIVGIDESLVIPNSGLSVYDGAVVCWRGEIMSEWKKEFIRRAEKYKFPIFEPYYKLTQEQKDLLWHGIPGEDKYESVCIDRFFDMLRENQYKIQYRVMLARYRGKTICPTCHGSRLKKEVTYIKVGGKSITDLVDMSIINLKEFFRTLKLSQNDAHIAKRLLTEINNRLEFLTEVGLGYLTLSRLSNTLSGGESQRINLAKNISGGLVGSLYVLDEPSIGLHSRDTNNLIHALRKLQEMGNTVVVVEHDEEIMRAADYIIDIGPNAGDLGGQVVFCGSQKDITAKSTKDFPDSHTLKYLLGEEKIPVPTSRRSWNASIEIKCARANNLKGIDVKFPLNVMTVVTGVSGSGKSTLVRDILYRAIKRNLDEPCERPGEFTSMEGDINMIESINFVDQNPIGTSSRSNPVTYLGAYDEIRKLMASQQLAKQMGYTPAFFSFNAEGGRCDECKGEGTVTIEMQFMNDIVMECESCHGKRFKKEILDVKFDGLNIYDILEMTVSQAQEFFTRHKLDKIAKKLQPLQDVGLGYIKLGQPSSTLSGGENQRVKLAYYLAQEKTKPTMFIFDEPTTGLHFHDITKLLHSFSSLISRGHTIVIIEHNIEVIKCADHIIDLGPEGGSGGGNIVICGTPEEVAKCPYSYTGQYLQDKLLEEQNR